MTCFVVWGCGVTPGHVNGTGQPVASELVDESRPDWWSYLSRPTQDTQLTHVNGLVVFRDIGFRQIIVGQHTQVSL